MIFSVFSFGIFTAPFSTRDQGIFGQWSLQERQRLARGEVWTRWQGRLVQARCRRRSALVGHRHRRAWGVRRCLPAEEDPSRPRTPAKLPDEHYSRETMGSWETFTPSVPSKYLIMWIGGDPTFLLSFPTDPTTPTPTEPLLPLVSIYRQNYTPLPFSPHSFIFPFP